MKRRSRLAAFAADTLVAQVFAECEVPVTQRAPALAAAIPRGEQPHRDNIGVKNIGQAVLADVLQRELEPR